MGLNKPVDFTTAKLLKEKGFDEPCSHAYKEVESPVLYIHQDKKYNNSFKKEWQNTVRKNSSMDNATINRYSAPTIAEVTMWCFNKYKYSIEYSMNIPESGEYDGCYVFNGLIKGSEDYKLKIFYTSKDYPTIEKALEDTINHFLINFC